MHFIYIFINITWYVISFLKRDKTKKIHSPIINDDHHHQWSSSNHHNHNHTHTHRHTLSHNKHFLLEYQIFFCLLDVKLLVLFAEFIHFFCGGRYLFSFIIICYNTQHIDEPTRKKEIFFLLLTIHKPHVKIFISNKIFIIAYLNIIMKWEEKKWTWQPFANNHYR